MAHCFGILRGDNDRTVMIETAGFPGLRCPDPGKKRLREWPAELL